jgi:hypothetical protein
MDPHKSLSEALDKYGTQDPKQTVSHRGVAAYALDLREDIFKETPRIITLDTKGASNEDLLAELVSHFNTQLRWLLVSACESYFIFIKEIYGAIGYLDQGLWPCEHYGPIRLREVKHQTLTWYKERIKKIRADDIFKNLRIYLPDLGRYECPSYMPNPKFWILLIEKFRHSIVHAGGIIDIRFLIDYLAKSLNLRFNKRTTLPPIMMRMLKSHFKMVNTQPHIWLVDETGIRSRSYALIDRPFSRLIEELSSHACLVYACAIMHFGQKPYWERQNNCSIHRRRVHDGVPGEG